MVAAVELQVAAGAPQVAAGAGRSPGGEHCRSDNLKNRIMLVHYLLSCVGSSRPDNYLLVWIQTPDVRFIISRLITR